MDRPDRRWPSRRLVAIGAAFAIASWGALAFAGASRADPSPKPPDRQALAKHLLQTRAGGFMTGPAQALLRMIASGGRNLTFGQPKLPQAPIATGGLAPTASAFTNVRVNDPSLDHNQIDQTTQSETSIAVAGSNVAVGYNDSQRTPLFAEAGTSISGYSYSGDGGATWTDGGALPNAPEFNNFGDPWLTSDRSGNMYYSNLAFDAFNFNGDVTVAKSTDGGKTWSQPVPTIRPPISVFYFADKDAMTAGRDPSVASRDDIYVTWDDFSFDSTTGRAFTGLPVARSTDGGATWQVSYAARIPMSEFGCSFAQFIGAQPLVDPSDGTLWIAAEKISVNDPQCTGGKVHFLESIFRSTDGGKSFGRGVKIGNVTPATPQGLLGLAPGQYMRTIEFPVLALADGKLFAAWNDGGLDGHSHIRLASSANGGATWALSWATTGSNDEVQPALSGDASGLHLLYYRRNPNGTLDVFLSNKSGANPFDTVRVTTESSPGVFTIPPFDPIIAFGYMGDYITNVSDGGHLYFSWGDNRDIVTNFMWPNGRNDPDVFFAKQ